MSENISEYIRNTIKRHYPGIGWGPVMNACDVDTVLAAARDDASTALQAKDEEIARLKSEPIHIRHRKSYEALIAAASGWGAVMDACEVDAALVAAREEVLREGLDVLRKLRNECVGIESMAYDEIKQACGYTNLSVWKQRIDEATAYLASRSQETKS